MSGDDVELSEEQNHLDRTIAAFGQALAELRSRHSTGGIDEFANDALERMRAERIRAYTQASGPLYFGRIDRTKGGPTYIGRHAIVDRHNHLLAINWRAPAAEPFYAATTRDPRGITLRRRFDIEDDRVHGFVDERQGRESEDHSAPPRTGQGVAVEHYTDAGGSVGPPLVISHQTQQLDVSLSPDGTLATDVPAPPGAGSAPMPEWSVPGRRIVRRITFPNGRSGDPAISPTDNLLIDGAGPPQGFNTPWPLLLIDLRTGLRPTLPEPTPPRCSWTARVSGLGGWRRRRARLPLRSPVRLGARGA